MQHERDAEQQIAQYFSAVRQKPLLSREREHALAQQKDAGSKASRQLVSGSFVPREQGLKLTKDIEAGDAAVQELTEGNLRYVVSVAKGYRGKGLPFSDLIQEGNLGLMKAIAKFDPHKGLRLTTYAMWWIRQAISRAICEQTGTMVVPEYLQVLAQKVEIAQEKKRNAAGHEPSLPEIAAETGIPVAKVEEVRAFSRRSVTSLDAPVSEHRRESLQETLPAHNPAVEEVVYTHEENRLIQGELAALRGVDKRAQDILTQRYGLDGGDDKTLAEVGISYDISRERVRQIERQALLRLKKNPTLQALAAEVQRTPVETPASPPRRREPPSHERTEKQRQAVRDYRSRYNEKRQQKRTTGSHS
jgi:RNA polymerase sigma factor (sigma-70 family)